VPKVSRARAAANRRLAVSSVAPISSISGLPASLPCSIFARPIIKEPPERSTRRSRRLFGAAPGGPAQVALDAVGGELGVAGQVHRQLEHSERDPFMEEALVDRVTGDAWSRGIHVAPHRGGEGVFRKALSSSHPPVARDSPVRVICKICKQKCA